MCDTDAGPVLQRTTVEVAGAANTSPTPADLPFVDVDTSTGVVTPFLPLETEEDVCHPYQGVTTFSRCATEPLIL